MGATIKFVIYTMAGSLLMLALVIAYGLSQDTLRLRGGDPELERLDLPGVRRGLRREGLTPLHGWLPDAYWEAPPEVAAMLSGSSPRRPSTASSGFASPSSRSRSTTTVR